MKRRPASATLPGMSSVRVLTVCGSLQAASRNQALLDRLRGSRALDPQVEVCAFRGLGDLPHFDLDQNAGEPPAAVRAWREALAGADGVFIASPEYGHSLPGALKNAIDWVFGSGELHHKPVAVTASSASKGRGRRGLAALCQTLSALDAVVLGGEPIVRGPGQDADAARLLGQLVAVIHRLRKDGVPRSAGALPDAVEALLRGTTLRAPLLARLGGAEVATAQGLSTCMGALAELLADTLETAPPGGPELVLARLDASLDGPDASALTTLLDTLIAQVDASPALHVALDALGPRALAYLGE